MVTISKKKYSNDAAKQYFIKNSNNNDHFTTVSGKIWTLSFEVIKSDSIVACSLRSQTQN